MQYGLRHTCDEDVRFYENVSQPWSDIQSLFNLIKTILALKLRLFQWLIDWLVRKLDDMLETGLEELLLEKNKTLLIFYTFKHLLTFILKILKIIVFGLNPKQDYIWSKS